MNKCYLEFHEQNVFLTLSIIIMVPAVRKNVLKIYSKWSINRCSLHGKRCGTYSTAVLISNTGANTVH